MKTNSYRKSRLIVALIFGWSLLCPLVEGQVSGRPGRENPVQPVLTRTSRTREESELAKDNESRVAASAVQIRVVLLRDPGLLVELKHWIAKEATDNGQLHVANAFEDQAIHVKREKSGSYFWW